jgi:hypothetical protein
MGDVKTVRGTLGGATVETSEENAARLGSAFEPEKAEAKRTTRNRRSADDDK